MITRTILRKFLPRVEIWHGDKEDAWSYGANGQNGLFRIWFWSDIDHRAAVAAEELYEWRWNGTWRPISGLLSAAVAFLVLWAVSPEISFLATLAGLAGFVLLPQLHIMQRRKELMSHEIGTQVAVQFQGVDAVEYRRNQISPAAGGMKTYPWLKNMTAEEIEAGMLANTAKAKAWIHRNGAFLTKVHRWKP